jgi:hypothetical protein
LHNLVQCLRADVDLYLSLVDMSRRRAVYTHDLCETDDHTIEEYDGEYDIDVRIDTIQAYATNQRALSAK